MIFSIDGNSVASVYDVGGNLLQNVYDVNGDDISAEAVDYTSYTVDKAYKSFNITPSQGFAIKDGYLFQFRATGTSVYDSCVVKELSSGDTEGNLTITSGHGDSASFSREYYAESDEFPLLYVTADTNPAKVYVNRVTKTTASLVKTYSFPLAQAGYYAAHAYDEDNEIMYMVGYTEQNYTSDDGGNNKTLVSKWDMSQLTQNQDGSYTPTFISSYQIPFIYCMQGLQFHDGMIWISSGINNGSYIYVLDPSDGTTLHTFDLETTTEVEGLDFISNTEMVVGFQGGIYWKYTFAKEEVLL